MSWFGQEGAALERILDLPRVVTAAELTSTMDLAHEHAASGAPSGTLILAESQARGRGRGGNRWQSEPRAGIWMTLLERPRDASALEVLSLRIGVALAPVLERWTEQPIRLKWPNDLFVGEAKLAGVLVEARWREQRPEWVAIGLGVNLRVPTGEPAAALVDAGALTVLEEIVPALRAAAFAAGPLRPDELDAFSARDLVRGRQLLAPAPGTACGITADGAVLIESEGVVTPWRAGSLVLSP